jgi:hypothetical protein
MNINTAKKILGNEVFANEVARNTGKSVIRLKREAKTILKRKERKALDKIS